MAKSGFEPRSAQFQSLYLNLGWQIAGTPACVLPIPITHITSHSTFCLGPRCGFTIPISSELLELKPICRDHALLLFSKVQHHEYKKREDKTCCLFMDRPIVSISGGC